MFRYASTDLVPPAGRQKEWLLTNGIGGFAASTISGINTRRYHGLLIASLKPPVDRRLLLAKLEEEVIVDGKRYKLFASQTLGGFAGYGLITCWSSKIPFPTYVYEIEDCILKRRLSWYQVRTQSWLGTVWPMPTKAGTPVHFSPHHLP